MVLDCDSNAPPQCQSWADDFPCVDYYEGILSGFSLMPVVGQHDLGKNVIAIVLIKFKNAIIIIIIINNIKMTDISLLRQICIYIYANIYIFFNVFFFFGDSFYGKELRR